MQTIIPPQPSNDGTTEDDRHAALVKLYDRSIDAAKGYVTMVEKAEPSFRDTAEQFRALHARQVDLLARLLADLGVDASPDGTMMGTVNKAVVTMRAFFDEIDADVMDQIRSGEDWVLKAFDAAITENQAHGFSTTLRELRDDLQKQIDATRHIG